VIFPRISRIFTSCRRWTAERLWRPFLRKSAGALARKAGLALTVRTEPKGAEWKRQALSDFDAWLAEMPEEMPEPAETDMTGCDLYTILTELTALRQEIKFQNREQHNTLKALEPFLNDLQELQGLFRDRTEGLERLEDGIRQSCEIRTASFFLDVRDALNRGLSASREAAAATGFFRRPPRGIEGIVEGYEMALRRFDRALSLAGIQPVPAVGRSFDPALMEAVDRKNDANAAPDVVLEELAGGFVRKGVVLRAAQVIVNGPLESRSP
jgi:molecular chaperone GrpE (heat shock protein)